MLGCSSISVAAAEPMVVDSEMARIKAGSYSPIFKQAEGEQLVSVSEFYLDKYQVTNRQFYDFTQRNRRWLKANTKPIFADKTYLQQFEESVLQDIASQPVVNVSWFAAMAYCKAQGKRLPTLDEWEYVARASEKEIDGSKSEAFREKILQWYSQPSSKKVPSVYEGQENYWGIYGMHGIVWELVRDFNTSLVTGESRGDASLDNQLFCGAGASSSIDPSDYAAFMRYALRSSYSSHYTLSSLGFRCAKDIDKATEVLP